MKNSSRLKTSLSLLLVSVLAATIMPTSVSASTDTDNGVVTVEVEIVTDPEPCTSFATLTLPSTTQPATQDSRVTGNTSPTMKQLLTFLWSDSWFVDHDFSDNSYTDVDLQARLDQLNNTADNGWINWNAVKVPENATLDTLESIDYVPYVSDGVTSYRVEDIFPIGNPDGKIDIRDVPDWFEETRTTYDTEWFEVVYDADSCDEEMAVVLASRSPVTNEATAGAGFDDVEISFENGPFYPTVRNRGMAMLEARTDLEGQLMLETELLTYSPTNPESQDSDDFDVVAYGSSGTAQMRSLMVLFGTNPTGIYRTNFSFQLETGSQEYFEDPNGDWYFLVMDGDF